ncbi:hypothetical protein T492DRAFT_532912 [Pavlovales sp. CCMP2436]|nr:hypothetical protein T492DRAFT_532912 [Pavlovales sp. CCMP2436]
MQQCRRGHRRGMCENADEDIGATCVKTSTRSSRRHNATTQRSSSGVLWARAGGDHRSPSVHGVEAIIEEFQCARRRSNRRGCVEEVGVVVIVAEVIIVVVGAVWMNRVGTFEPSIFCFHEPPVCCVPRGTTQPASRHFCRHRFLKFYSTSESHLFWKRRNITDQKRVRV